MMYIHPAHHISEVLSHQTQSPHDNGLRFSVCFPVLLVHTETGFSFLLRILQNTVRLHNAYGRYPTVSFRSVNTAEYHENPHRMHTCNAHHLSPPDLCLSLCSSEGAVYWLLSVPGCHDPEAPGKSCPFRKFLRSVWRHALLLRTYHAPDIFGLLLPDTQTGQWYLHDIFPGLPYPHAVYNRNLL